MTEEKRQSDELGPDVKGGGAGASVRSGVAAEGPESIAKDDFARGDFHSPDECESAIVYGLIWCPHTTDLQGDTMGEAETRKTLDAFKADIEAGKVLEMGVNHEGEPTPTLKALALECACEDVTVGGFTFHAGDMVLKAELFGDRLAAFKAGEMTGFSLEGIEDDDMQETERGEESKTTPHPFTPAAPAPAQLFLPMSGATVTVTYE